MKKTNKNNPFNLIVDDFGAMQVNVNLGAMILTFRRGFFWRVIIWGILMDLK